jgi:hypothetical protein
MGYIERKGKAKAQTYYTGKNPKQQSISERISFGTGKGNKQSPGFLEMIVNTIKKAID